MCVYADFQSALSPISPSLRSSCPRCSESMGERHWAHAWAQAVVGVLQSRASARTWGVHAYRACGVQRQGKSGKTQPQGLMPVSLRSLAERDRLPDNGVGIAGMVRLGHGAVGMPRPTGVKQVGSQTGDLSRTSSAVRRFQRPAQTLRAQKRELTLGQIGFVLHTVVQLGVQF